MRKVSYLLLPIKHIRGLLKLFREHISLVWISRVDSDTFHDGPFLYIFTQITYPVV